MSFLDVNGYAVPLAHDSVRRRPVEVLARFGRGYDGSLRRSRSAEKIGWEVRTIPVAEATAELIEGLLMGRGFYFPFETSLYDAQKGFGPNTGYACTLTDSGEKVGTRCLSVGSGATGVVYATGFTADWSVMLWQFVDAAWKHICVVYDADATTYTEYVNGAAGDAINDTWRALISAGNLTLVGKAYDDNGNQAALYDDMVVVPYKLDSTIIAWHYNSGTGRAFSELPFLSATGDILKTTTAKSIACRVVEEDYKFLAGSDNYRSLTIEIEEA
jgi:hypothetical protein